MFNSKMRRLKNSIAFSRCQSNYDSMVPPSYFDDSDIDRIVDIYGDEEDEVRENYCNKEQNCTDIQCREECDSCHGLREIFDIIGIN